MATSKNERFVRLWWEISEKYSLPIRNKWYRYAKGGTFCKWYGNNWATLNWENNGRELHSYKKAVLRNQDYYLKEGITYTGSGSKGTTFRLHERDSLFDVGGSCIFSTGAFNNLNYIIAFMNSRLSFYLINCLNPTVNTQVGDLKRVPFVKPQKEYEQEVSDLADQCIQIKKVIDKKYLLNGANSSPLNITTSVTETIHGVILTEVQGYINILINELIIDHMINTIYELNKDDLNRMIEKMGVCAASIPVYFDAVAKYKEDIDVSEKTKEILDMLPVINYNDEQLQEIQEKVSAVFYSKNNEIEDFCKNNELNPITVWYFIKYKNAIPQVKARDLVFEWLIFALRDILNDTQDGIVSLTSTDKPIIERLESYADKKSITSAQLLQMEEFFGKKIQDFIERDFFNELMNYTNVFMYLPKTPFIWHLSSGENGGFDALTLIYKWNADSLYKMKSKYISMRREKLEFRKTQLANLNTAQAIDEKELIDKQLKEIDIFVTKIEELIAQGYNPTLDDGVGKNIAPLQDKKMLKSDVLNVNQLKKYLKAEW